MRIMSETNAAAEVAAPHRYTAALAADIEARWQDFWDANGTYDAPNPGGDLTGDADVVARPKKFVMDMFPYPSGAGLHVGHPLGYIATDVYARYHRMTGHNVLHTLGFDAFGLPAEQYAVQTGTHPRVSTEANIDNMRRQLRRLGLGHDQRRSFATIDPDYYKWTQWIFLRIFNSWYDPEADKARPIDTLAAQFASGERATPDGRPWDALTEAERADLLGEYRLAYASDAPVNWCPGLGTVLANEEVTADGRSERGNFPVFKAKLRQWNMRITAYADRLLDDLDALDWPEAIKLQQRNWIGRSEGARVDFPVQDHPDAKITVFTTRQDTLFGATYMVLAPEHDLVDSIVPAAWPEGTHDVWTGGHATPAAAVDAYRKQAAAKSDVERQAEVKDKTGVFTGAYAVNPVSGDRVPVFIADYVLMGYGTGAIMAVPAHDGRDFAFARAFELPMRCVVEPSDDRGTDPSTWDDAFASYDAKIVNSAGEGVSLDGLGVTEAKARITEWLEARSIGEGTVNFRLRDWLFSRQRYWGEPFPIVYDEDGVAHALPESMLPLELPEVEDYSPRTFDPDDADTSPETPLSRNEEWVHVELDLGDGRGPRPFRRETNTMPNWAGSCWYELRYLDPHNSEQLVAPGTERYWMGPRDGPAARRRRPVRRRRRARRAAPAVRPLLVQGAVRPGARLVGRAVPQAVQPGHDPGVRLPGQPRHRRPGRRGRGARRGVLVRGREGHPAAGQDGQVPEERRHPGRDLRRVRGRHAAPVRDGHGPAGRLAPLGHPRGRRPVPAAPAAVAERRGRGHRRGHRRRRGARRGHAARPAQGDRRGPPGHGGPALQHRHRQDHRAEQPRHQGARGAALDRRADGAADRAAGPAHRRGAVAQAGPRRVGRPRAVPGRRPGVRRGRDGDLRGPGQGQGQGPAGGRPVGLRRGAGGAGPGRPGGGRCAERRGHPQGHRAGAETGEHRPGLTTRG
ncbi:leucine-tRNA ligase [Streptomyces himastatinicus ATCC 53653]|uniref:leucine--tRNA ligase n=1 Tax=Streptomyces himastatinicus ATCC 53653 TaxID=457427 RepID=D9WRP3_9ACTN|nr:leucine-tRNA ligase [Streptomyces himastatinicus ATCC 53653]